MARIETVRLVDDLTGEQADETVGFVVDGVQYELDLTGTHAAELRAVFAPYVEAGRADVALRRLRAASSSMSTERRQHNNAVRVWAREHGHKIGDRGRIPAQVVDAYEHQASRSGGDPSPRAAKSAAVRFHAAV